MAGIKGKSGGARPNTGGARPGAGRPKTPQQTTIGSITDKSPLEFMIQAMNNPHLDDKLRLEAAKAAAPYIHQKADSDKPGKKETITTAAKTNHTGSEWADLLTH